MTYQSLYRKYRSSDFTELVGQEHVIKTLSNAIEYNRLNHAYIFSGPRGTGKTSTARILAKMVNKTSDDISDCEICKKITAGVCVDVIEIDAASHTGVDHMRQLTEQVQFLPIEAKYKVFIIDEVHMLSTGAFNALLKTLEEPPANILFMLATTELHKIPATIQSRSQTLHFKLLDNNHISSHIKHVCDQENIQIDDQALVKVVQTASGGMRDALSLLDQLISVSSGSKITVDDISLVLGTMSEATIIEFLDHCFSFSMEAVVQLNSFINEGVNVFQFYDDVLSYLNQSFLVSKEHNFSASDLDISNWMLWFCDQLSMLKTTQLVDVTAQVALKSRLLLGNASPQNSHKNNVNSTTNHAPVKQTPTQSIPSQAKPAAQDIQSALNHSNEPKHTPQTIQPKPVQDQTNDNVSKKVLGKQDILEQILVKVNQEFKVVAPVLTGAAFVEHGDYLCLVLEQSYQFFEKKLSETKYQTWFLNQYNQFANTNFSKWFVTSDINAVYQLSVEKSADQGNINKEQHSTVQSNTVNQIVEMFDAHVIH